MPIQNSAKGSGWASQITATAASAANAIQRLLGRELIGVGYSRDGRFRQDPARTTAALPDLAPSLPEDLRDLWDLLLDPNMYRVARETRTPRATLYYRLDRLRTALREAGL